MKMHSKDFAKEGMENIRKLFPQCVTEVKNENGVTDFSIDFDQLRQELAPSIVEGPRERYQLNWPGKREAQFIANAPIAKTLRPVPEQSLQFEQTSNLFIEGDNLNVLKLLQETYLGKIKLIYIDPPYNTGNDFLYEDDFSETSDAFLKRSNQKDSTGNRLIANTVANGRFHSDWLSMMYPRLRLAKTLLSDDGVIFVSIDTNEVANLRLLMDEVFGVTCYKNTIAVRRGIKNVQAQFEDVSALSLGHEYILMYSKNSEIRLPKLMWTHETQKPGKWDTFWRGTDRPTMRYELLGVLPETGQWRWEEGRTTEAIKNYQEYLDHHASHLALDEWYLDTLTSTNIKLNFVRKSEEGTIQYYVPPSDGRLLSDNWMDITLSGNETEFDTEKNVSLLDRIVSWICPKDEGALILDFFAGSATTGEAVMRRNAIDKGNRRFILVQIPADCDANSPAYKAGFKTISDIGKSRLKKVSDELIKVNTKNLIDSELDFGFRVLREDSSNFSDVYYAPDKTDRENISLFVENIKADRTPYDILFQVLLDWGVDLTLPIADQEILGRRVFFVDGNALVACFDDKGRVDEHFSKELASYQPLRVVFRDSGYSNDSAKINVEQIFRAVSPSTEVKTI